ncbi:MAG: hypothetical protein WAW58_01750 [Lactococcus raffinolactis]|nr:hypothetical protein [Saprospiraceae bacterium]
MEFNIFIAPLTMTVVELFKRFGAQSKYLALVAVLCGAGFGALYGFIYKGDLISNVFQGLLYGASASGVYDAASHTTAKDA